MTDTDFSDCRGFLWRSCCLKPSTCTLHIVLNCLWHPYPATLCCCAMSGVVVPILDMNAPAGVGRYYLSTVTTIDWVLFGSGKSIKGWNLTAVTCSLSADAPLTLFVAGKAILPIPASNHRKEMRAALFVVRVICFCAAGNVQQSLCRDNHCHGSGNSSTTMQPPTHRESPLCLPCIPLNIPGNQTLQSVSTSDGCMEMSSRRHASMISTLRVCPIDQNRALERPSCAREVILLPRY